MEASLQHSLASLGYHPVALIAMGGYAKIYTVTWDKYPGITFVAKVMLVQENFDLDGEKAYLSEINSLSCLCHTNIVKIYDHFLANGRMVIIMEYYPNGTLGEMVKNQGPLNCNDFKKIAREALLALDYCHKNSFAHRDIKPNNFLFDYNYRLILCDFGLSDEIKNELISRQDGSLAYAPPEMFGDDPYNAKLADIWSLGLTFYYAVVGELPWSSKERKELRSEILNKRIEIPKTVHPEVKDFIQNLINREPYKRVSAEELLNHPFLSRLPHLDSTEKRKMPIYRFNTSYYVTFNHKIPLSDRYYTFKGDAPDCINSTTSTTTIQTIKRHKNIHQYNVLQINARV